MARQKIRHERKIHERRETKKQRARERESDKATAARTAAQDRLADSLVAAVRPHVVASLASTVGISQAALEIRRCKETGRLWVLPSCRRSPLYESLEA